MLLKWFILGSLYVFTVSAHALKCENEFDSWMSFQDAKTFIQTVKLTSMRQFQQWSKSEQRPKNFPSRPDRTYKEEWTNWGDFLGTRNLSTRKRQWMSFQDAKTFIQKQRLTSHRQFQQWSKSKQRPKNFPSIPDQTYKDQWISWRDFLGTENISQNKTEWMSFQDAKTFIQTVKLTSMRQFQQWSKSEQRPKNFPSRPERTYKSEWTNWGDFLGTRNISHNKGEWMSFQDAKTFIQKQGLTSHRQFQQWSKSKKRPKNFPSSPDQTYKDEWISWGDFLGTENLPYNKGEWMNFQEAKTFIQQQGLTSTKQFQQWSKSKKRPKNFPSSPEQTYKDEWISWGDFLGTENISNNKREWMSFQDAKTFIQKQRFISYNQFRKWSESEHRPKNFPSAPDQTYKSEWTNWGDFLGTGNISTRKRQWMSFQDAKTFIQKQGLTSYNQFQKWSESQHRPKNFPSSPPRTYKKEWTNWRDFLGTRNLSTRKRQWMSFQDAKTFIQKQGLTSHRQFQQWSKSEHRPENFPSAPDQTYKSEWTNWGDFLGTGNISNQQIARTPIKLKKKKQTGRRTLNRPDNIEQIDQDKLSWAEIISDRNEKQNSFDEIKNFLTQEIQKEFEQEGHKLENISSHSNQADRNTKTDQGGLENEKEWMSFQDAKKYVRTLEFENPKDFIEWLKSKDRPVNFPPNPQQTYSEWTNVKDFLSTETQKYISYKEAKTFVQKLGIKSLVDFFETRKNEPDLFPENFPSNPKLFYSKTGEWTDWNDFLGLTNVLSQESTKLSHLNPMDISNNQNNIDENNQNTKEDLLNDELNPNQEEYSTNDLFN